MSLAGALGHDGEWISLPEAARRLGVHRTAVNTMILDGRLPGERFGPYWRIEREQFEQFAARYRRPPNVPAPAKNPDAVPPVAQRALEWLARWHSASTLELREVMPDDPGNIRKATDILRQRGWAIRDDIGTWRLTDAGRAAAKRHGFFLTADV